MGWRIPGTSDVIGLPPAPWPIGYDLPWVQGFVGSTSSSYPDPPWGPPGTGYFWTLGQLLDRLTQLATAGLVRSHDDLVAIVGRVLAWLGSDAEATEVVALDTATSSAPVLLLPGYTEVPMAAIDFVSVQVHGKLGTYEEVSHTLNLVYGGGGAAPSTLAAADLTTIGQSVVTAWTNMILPPAGSGSPPATLSNLLGTNLVYDHVTVAAKHQTAPAALGGSRKGLIKNVGNSVVVPFGANVKGGYGNAMPFQTACVLTLGTQMRGASFRGRIFLGGLNFNWTISTDGQIPANTATAVGLAFGHYVVEPLAASSWHLNVWSPRLSAGRQVASVSVGLTLDTMRSRRRKVPDTKQLAWGTL